MPIEQKVDAELGVKKRDDGRGARSARRAASTPQEFVDIQREEFQRLGVLGATGRTRT